MTYSERLDLSREGRADPLKMSDLLVQESLLCFHEGKLITCLT
jgi:hypothetical protein